MSFSNPRYCYSFLGYNCVNKSSAATSNQKFILPSKLGLLDNGYGCTKMREYPCQKCFYTRHNVRVDQSSCEKCREGGHSPDGRSREDSYDEDEESRRKRSCYWTACK